MAFQRYDGSGQSRGRGGLAQVGFTARNGVLYLNAEAVRRFDVGNFTHCVLYFDPQTGRAAIELTNRSDVPGVAKLRVLNNDARGARHISALGFQTRFGLYRDGLVTHHALTVDPETGWLVFDAGERLQAIGGA